MDLFARRVTHTTCRTFVFRFNIYGALIEHIGVPWSSAKAKVREQLNKIRGRSRLIFYAFSCNNLCVSQNGVKMILLHFLHAFSVNLLNCSFEPYQIEIVFFLQILKRLQNPFSMKMSMCATLASQSVGHQTIRDPKSVGFCLRAFCSLPIVWTVNLTYERVCVCACSCVLVNFQFLGTTK